MKNCAWKESRNLCIIGKEYKEEKTMDILKNENIKTLPLYCGTNFFWQKP